MSVYLYDEALINKLKTIFLSKVTVTTYDKAFKSDATKSTSSDSVTLPMISIYRTSYSIQDTQIQYTQKRQGILVRATSTQAAVAAQVLPITINWQLDIWAASRRQADDICRELIFYFTLNPLLSIHVPYGIDFDFTFNVKIQPDIEDNTDLSEFDDRGRYYRLTMQIMTDEACLFKSNTGPSYNIDAGIYDSESNPV